MENKFNQPVNRICPYCHSEYQIKPGLSNIKNLFRKPSWNEWFILALLLLVLIGCYFYYNDIKTCRATITNIDSICRTYNIQGINNNSNDFDLGNFTNQISGHLANAEEKINNIKIIPNDKIINVSNNKSNDS